MRVQQLLVAAAALTSSSVLAAPSSSKSFKWGQTIRGVNLGGWLVLEPWITPDLFNDVPGQVAVDEYTLCETYGKTKCREVLEQHYKTWITQADIQRAASYGLNMVRIPIGFWAFKEFPPQNTPYVTGADRYLDLAIQWCREAGLKVLIDLHGAPLSQNGFDNSGHRLPVPGWGHGKSVDDTLKVIGLIANKYAQDSYSDVVIGIELLNEPLDGSGLVTTELIQQYYTAGWNIVRQISNRFVVLHDAFQPLSSWNGFLSPSSSTRVAMDHHEYQVFSDSQVALTPSQHRQAVCSGAVGSYGDHTGHIAFVGEWSAAMTDCATWLNGYKVGARYDGTYPGSTRIGSCKGKNDISTWSQGTKDNHRWYIETQLDAFNAETSGWIFWTLKTAHSGEWDMTRLVNAGIFPQPLDSRKFPKVCTNL